jgi:osmotically-inducible protein OsmY
LIRINAIGADLAQTRVQASLNARHNRPRGIFRSSLGKYHLEDSMSHETQLQQAVLAELNWEPSVNAAHIGVAVTEDGVVTLMGHVGNYAEKHAAASSARHVKGVRAVIDEIEVRLPTGALRDDEDVADTAIDSLDWDVAVPKGAVKVTVQDGWVTLTGEVDWHFQKEAAEQDVRRLAGVIAVSNQITIKRRVDATNISDDIMHALHRSWFFDPKTINVTAEGGNVRLTGTVHSPHDRQLAAATAWAAPGAINVENDIVVV